MKYEQRIGNKGFDGKYRMGKKEVKMGEIRIVS